jgi:hypothetical protein
MVPCELRAQGKWGLAPKKCVKERKKGLGRNPLGFIWFELASEEVLKT